MYRLSEDQAVARRQRMERAIVRWVVRDALAAGYALTVDDGGEEYPLVRSTDYSAIMHALLNTDEDYLLFRNLGGDQEKGLPTGFVRFVYGNAGWEVICDYTPSIEPVLKDALKLAEALEMRYAS